MVERPISNRFGITAQEPGQKLRRVREKLRLRYRDVEKASHRIAHYKGNDDFLVGLSRLADIENKGTVPTIYRLYSLCAIYGIDFADALQWYGIDLLELPSDSARVGLEPTRLLHFDGNPKVQVDLPTDLEETVDLRNTSYISRQVQQWGKLPLSLLSSIDLRRGRYAFVGLDDWSMHPILAPGSFLQIDAAKTKIVSGGWSNEHERPIYFLEQRKGYQCGWCTERDGMLIVQTHVGSSSGPELLRYPGDVEVIGQVVAVAMRLDAGKRRHTRS